MSRSYSPAEMSALRDPLLEPRPGQHAAAATPNAGTTQRLPHGQSASPDKTHEEQKTEARDVEPRKQYEHRGRAYILRSSEIQAMTDIGKFRAVAAKDLEEFVYQALTKEGYRLLVATKSTQKEQVLYQGFAKPREAHYDADLQYASWIGSATDHVINSAVKMMLWRDKSFLAWRKTQDPSRRGGPGTPKPGAKA